MTEVISVGYGFTLASIPIRFDETETHAPSYPRVDREIALLQLLNVAAVRFPSLREA